MKAAEWTRTRTLSSYCQTYAPGASRHDGVAAWVMGVTLSGFSENVTDRGEFRQARNDLTVLAPEAGPSQRWHVPRHARPWKILWFLVNPAPAWLNLSALPAVLPGVMHVSFKDDAMAARVKKAMLAAHRILHSRWPNRGDLCLNLLEQALLWAQASVSEQERKMDPRILHAMEYMMQHLFDPLSLAHLCRQAGLSQSRFMELFQRETGTTPRILWERERLRHAQSLLALTDRSIKEISAIVGYRYTPHFARRFRSMFGLAPLQYRERQRRGAGRR
ncbi:MAG: AraC family transcriptional regulator [Kiritimatiellae bacterium]|nr:AraC family transcriptional regulator [Kiritimatiellia bacterium]